jgi:hypothetical protein
METGKTADPPAARCGQRIKLVSVETVPGHPPCDLLSGDEGTVRLVDSLGTVHVAILEHLSAECSEAARMLRLTAQR